jgi:hypothetical protein
VFTILKQKIIKNLVKNHHKFHEKCLRISIAFSSSILIQVSSILELNLGSNLAPCGSIWAPWGNKKLTLVSRKPQGSILIDFSTIFIDLGPPFESFGLQHRFPSHEKTLFL